MKLFLVFLSGIVLALSGMSEASCGTANDRAQSIDKAQKCARDCGYFTPKNSTKYSNLLQECSITGGSPLSSCCFANNSTSTCLSDWSEAEKCLANELSDLKKTAEAYFGCMLGNCDEFNQKICVNVFAGGYGEDSSNNFAVGDSSILAERTRNATSCDDEGLNKFGIDFCDTLTACCGSCDEEVGKLANAILDYLLVPAYGRKEQLSTPCSKTGDGSNKTCAADYSVPQARFLETERASLAGPKTLSPENAKFAADLAFECNEGLNNDMVVHNETYAISNYLDCVYKKTGKAAAQQEDSKQAESSSSSLSFGPTAALSAIASSLYAIVVA